MEHPLEINEEPKVDLESEKPLCRCCLSTENRMLDAKKLGRFFMELAGIDVLSSDGLPPWICYECHALLRKAVTFKIKMLRAHTILYEYITRCAPFPIAGGDPELSAVASPQLCTTDTLITHTLIDTHIESFHDVLEHSKRVFKSELNVAPVEVEAPRSRGNDVKLEPEAEGADVATDYEDDIPLLEYRTTENEILSSLLDAEEIKNELEGKKTKKKKERKTKKRKINRDVEDDIEETPPMKKSIRKSIEIDTEKIRIITLNPEEQVKRREEESKASLKFPFQCSLCYKGFNFQVKLQNHMYKHSPSRGPFSCNLCRMYFPTRYSQSSHLTSHTTQYECIQCGRRMTDRASIQHHYRTQHEGIATIISCNLCGKTSSNYKTHRGHMRNHHSGSRVECSQCGKSFVNKDSLTEHLQIHDGVKNYECSVCGKRCRTRTQIKQHQLKHADTRAYYCVECDVRFKTAHSLRQHLVKSLKHRDLDSLPFPCTRCPKRYDKSDQLATHVSIAHEGVRAHPCAACGASLATRAALRKHVASVHDGVRVPAKHVCDTCGKAFRGKSVLTNHLRTHTGEKPFVCGACGRAFTQRTAMRTHLRRVHCKPDKMTTSASQTYKRPKLELLSDAEMGQFSAQPPKLKPWHPPEELFYVTAGP